MTDAEKKKFVAKMKRARAAAKRGGSAPKKKGAKKTPKKKGAKKAPSLETRVSSLETNQGILRRDINTVAGVVEGHHRFLTGVASVMRARFGAKSVPALSAPRKAPKKARKKA